VNDPPPDSAPRPLLRTLEEMRWLRQPRLPVFLASNRVIPGVNRKYGYYVCSHRQHSQLRRRKMAPTLGCSKILLQASKHPTIRDSNSLTLTVNLYNMIIFIHLDFYQTCLVILARLVQRPRRGQLLSDSYV
jgi:hypothetical protein